MSETSTMNSVPNVFYDLIAFAPPTISLAIGGYVGFGLWNVVSPRDLGGWNVALILLALFFLSYEYGRSAEACSSLIVQWPLALLHKWGLLRSRDFLDTLGDVEGTLGLKLKAGARPGGKWAVYFYALRVDPGVGSDLLKRYAWEKLSRSSAYTFALLLFTSVTIHIVRRWLPANVVGVWQFGTVWFDVTLLVLMIATYYEYYRRNCWNNDLIRKVLAVLSMNAKASDATK